MRLPQKRPLNASSYVTAFISEYIFKQSQSSPSDRILYVDFLGLQDLHARYKKELCGRKALKMSYFAKLWNKTLCKGVTDPETAVEYCVRIRKGRAKGFKKCDLCQFLKQQIAGSTNSVKRAAKERKLEAHIVDINADRETLARIQRKCIIFKNHCGFYMDAADSAKFAIPTTKSTAKMMSKLWTIKQKLTCVQMFDFHKTLYMFRTLPDVPTGGNLTATILTYMIDNLDLSEVTDLWMNVDGAGDNINYTLYYFLTHILLKAKEKDWPLKRIHILRMKVGHTHCELDATFAALSKFVYGKHSRGDSRKNILSLSSFKEVCCGGVHAHAQVRAHTLSRCTHTLSRVTAYTHTRARTHRCVVRYTETASLLSKTFVQTTTSTSTLPTIGLRRQTNISRNNLQLTSKSVP